MFILLFILLGHPCICMDRLAFTVEYMISPPPRPGTPFMGFGYFNPLEEFREEIVIIIKRKCIE